MSFDRPRYDVIVVGARAAGAATAMLLARAGLDVLVVDRGSYRADTLSTHALMRGGVMQLHRWGLLDGVIGAGTPAIRRTIFRYAHDEIVVTIKPAYCVDALYAPRRTVLDPLLVDAAMAAGATIRYGITVTDLRRDRDGRVVGIDARDGHGVRMAADADLVIGADGLRSVVADHVGAKIVHTGTSAGAYIYGYWSDVSADGYEWDFRPGAAAGLIPTNDERTCVFVGSTPERIGRGGPRAFDRLLLAASPNLARRVSSGIAPPGLRTFSGHPSYLRQAWGPGWALVGDAGYWKDPISAHGLTDALRDAELLARAVIAGRTGELSLGEALAGYQNVRDRLSRPLLDTTDAIGSYRWSEHEIGPLLLQLSSAMADEVEALAALDTAAVPC